MESGRSLAYLMMCPRDHTSEGVSISAQKMCLQCSNGAVMAQARAAAQHVVGTNDEGGVADAIERFVLQPRAAMAKTA